MRREQHETGNPFPGSHLSPGSTGEIDSREERQNNHTKQDHPGQFLHFRPIQSVLYPRKITCRQCVTGAAAGRCIIGASFLP